MRQFGVYAAVCVCVCVCVCVFGSAADAQPPGTDAGLIAHYDAAVGVITNANGVAIWEDLAGGDNDATHEPSYGPGFPELSCGTFPSGEHAVVYFNGDTGLICAQPELLNLEPEVSVYIVSESTTGGNVFTNYSNSINWGYGYIVRWHANNGPSFFTANGIAETHSDSNSPTITTDGYHILTATFSNLTGEKRLYIDQDETPDLSFDGLQTGLGYDDPVSTRTSIGSFLDFGLRREHTGGIAEILIYDSVDDTQRLDVWEYFNDKFYDPGSTPPALPDLPPTGLACAVKLDGSKVTLNWNRCGAYTSQQVLRDGEEIASIGGDVGTFVDNDPLEGNVTYAIEATTGSGDLLGGECSVLVELPFFEGRIMHLAADLGVVSGPRGVETWVDQSPIAGQQDAFKQDAFGTGQIVESCGDTPNGTHPVLQFPGTNDISTGAAFGILSPNGLRKRDLSIYTVVEFGVGGGTILSIYSNSINWGYGLNLRLQSGGTGSVPCFFTSAGTGSTIHDVCSSEFGEAGYHILTVTMSSLLEEKKVYIDGVLLPDSNYVPGCTLEDPPCNQDFDGRNLEFDGAENPSIGSFREFQDGDGSHRYHEGGIAEIIVYDSVDEDQREMVEAELRAKYFEGQGNDNLPPSGLTCSRSPDGTEVELNWANCGTYEALRLLRNGEAFFDLSEDATSFTDSFNVPLGNVTYTVQAEFDDGSMAGPSCTARDSRTVGCPPALTDPQLVLWLDADRGVTTDANGVTTWADQTGGNDAVTSVDDGVAEPPFFGIGWPQETTAAFPAGNFAVLDFDGNTGMEVENPADFALGEVSMFVVAETGPGIGQLITNYNNSVNWGWGWNFHGLGREVFNGGDPTAINLFTSSGTCGSYGDTADSGLLTPMAGTYAILSATISNTSGSKAIYVDGVLGVVRQMGNANAAGCSPDSGSDFVPTINYDGGERVGIGSFREFDVGTRAHIGGIAEILILSSADQQLHDDIVTYLTTKYITGDTPADCPDAPDPTGACVAGGQGAGGSCDIQTQADCEAGGGTYQGDFSSCPTGACCTAGVCDVQSEEDCLAGGGRYQGDAVTCGEVQCPTGEGFRRGDHDGSGIVDITDPLNLLGFLFLGQTPPICQDASDADNSMALDISDALNALGFLFLGSFPLNETLPGPTNCGPDPTVEIDPDGEGPLPPQPVGSLGCDLYPSATGLPCN